MSAPRQTEIIPAGPANNRGQTPFRSRWERLLGKCESPVESDFLAALCPLAVDHGYRVARFDNGRNETIVVRPQENIDHYRVDFLVRFAFFGHELFIAVEIDGHEWHERTKAQARRDKSRDRAIQRLGCEVFRFTGSEVRGAPSTCAGGDS